MLQKLTLIGVSLWLLSIAPFSIADNINPLITPSDTAHPITTTAKLNYLEIHQRAHQTTVVLQLKNNALASAFTLSKPNRLVIDLSSTTISSAMPKQIQDHGLIQQIRFGPGPDDVGNVRLVLDLAQSCNYALLVDDNPQQHQQTITVILTPKEETVSTNPSTEPLDLNHFNTPALNSPALKASTKPIPDVVGIHSSDARLVRIVIDPGHGGKDSGAVAANHLMEKTVVLAIGKRLIQLLNQQAGIKAKLTRQGDYFITLRERLHLARRYHADVFMSVHADAFSNDDALGASVFALSQHGATSEAARWLAQAENSSEFAGLPFKTTNRQLKSILLDMSQTATNQDSLSLGSDLLQQLTPMTPLHARSVEQAGFVVLKSPDIPSILVETGFISNPTEANLLNDPDFQQKIATALMQGIVRYCQQNPPPNSYFEMHFKNKANN